MWSKIKNLFTFFKNAWLGSARGKWGIIFMITALFFFVRLFCGTQNVQNFIMNTWRLNHNNKELTVAQKNLEKIQNHIYLLQHTSPDYVEELGLKTLNLGNPEFKELKY